MNRPVIDCRRLVATLVLAFAPVLDMTAQQTPAREQFRIMIVDDEESNVLARGTVTPILIRFEVRDSAVLASLRYGQTVYADLAAKEVSLDGTSVCCEIVKSKDIPAN
jgi:hypothetical protein